MLREMCPDGVEYKPLGEVGKFFRGSGLLKKDFVDEGLPCIHYGQIHTRFRISTDSTISFVTPELWSRLHHAASGDLLIATTSEDDAAVAKATAWLGEGEVAVGGDLHIFRHVLDPKYVSHFFSSTHFQNQKSKFISGAKVRRISSTNLSKIRIPVPPIEIQHEIALILDKFVKLEAELEAELEARRKQYCLLLERFMAFDPSVEWSTVREVCSTTFSGGTPRVTESSFFDGDIPWLRTKEVNFADIRKTEKTITAKGLANSSAKWVPPNSVIIAISGAGATRGRVAINKIALTTNQHCCALIPNRVNESFLYYWLVHSYDEIRSRGRGNRSDLTLRIVNDFPVPVPPQKEQESIVRALNQLNALLNDLDSGLPAEIAARRQQYEYYRDKLLTLPQKAV